MQQYYLRRSADFINFKRSDLNLSEIFDVGRTPFDFPRAFSNCQRLIWIFRRLFHLAGGFSYYITIVRAVVDEELDAIGNLPLAFSMNCRRSQVVRVVVVEWSRVAVEVAVGVGAGVDVHAGWCREYEWCRCRSRSRELRRGCARWCRGGGAPHTAVRSRSAPAGPPHAPDPTPTPHEAPLTQWWWSQWGRGAAPPDWHAASIIAAGAGHAQTAPTCCATNTPL